MNARTAPKSESRFEVAEKMILAPSGLDENRLSTVLDAVMSRGKMVGASMFAGYTYNERAMLSLGIVDEQYAKPGTQLTLVWGEEDGGTRKTTVERHRQMEMRVTVGPVPYAQPAREGYHQGWRTGTAKP